MSDAISRSAVLEMLSDEFDFAKDACARTNDDNDHAHYIGRMSCSMRARIKVMELPALDVVPVITGETSDGYHTFNELYHHRAVLFSVIVKAFQDQAWKARRHHDGSMYDGMFIVGIETPDGQATYHYDIEPYWDMFECKELEYAPEWDGHTPAQAIARIGQLEPVRYGRWIQNKNVPAYHYCSLCKVTHKMKMSCNAYVFMKYCPNCGAKMDGEADG